MSKVLHSQYIDDLTFVLDYLLDQDTYQSLKQRLTNQLLKSVKVDGFRDGHVPEAVAKKHIDHEKMQLTIYQETIERNFSTAFEEAKKILQNDERVALDSSVNITPETTGEIEDGFKFRITVSLLPQVDLSQIKGKIQITKPVNDDLPPRLGLEEFINREKENLLQAVNQKRQEIKEKTFENIETCFEELEDLKKQFGSIQGFEQFLTNLYTQETEFLLSDVKQKRIVEVILEKVPNFSLPQNRVNNEITRIVQSVQQEAERTKQDFGQIIVGAGIPNPKSKKVGSILDLTAVVSDYVQNEFKLMWVLRFIYEILVEEKITQEELDQVSREIQKDPAKYNIEKNLNENEYQNIAFDRLMRSKAVREQVDSWVTIIESEEIKSEKNQEISEAEEKPKTKKKTKN